MPRYRYVPYSCFKDLVENSELFKVASQYGGNTVPLSLVGMYMNYAGNHLLSHIYDTYDKKIFHPCHRVVSV